MPDNFHWPGFLPAFSAAAENAGFNGRALVETTAGPVMVWQRLANGPHVYLSAGIHGDEPAGPAALLELMRSGFFSPHIHWSVCPALNPTGLAAGTRESADGIDLNRDYWKALARETEAHAAWLGSRPVPDLFLSLHEDWESTGFYFYEINLGPDRPERAAAILDAVRPVLPPEPSGNIDDHKPRKPGWIYHEAKADLPQNWPEAIYMSKHGCPLSFTFETPSSALLGKRVEAHKAAVTAALGSLAGRL